MEVKQTALEWLIEQWPILESQIPTRILDEAKKIEELDKETEYRRGFQDGKQYYKEEYVSRKNN